VVLFSLKNDNLPLTHRQLYNQRPKFIWWGALHISAVVKGKNQYCTIYWLLKKYIKEGSVVIICFVVCFMVFNTSFNNISIISWRSVLLLEETGVPGENH